MKLILLFLLLYTTAVAQPAHMVGIVEQHNYWRKQVGVPPLKWSSKLAMVAQAWANSQMKKDCKCAHSNEMRYGENIFCSEGSTHTSGDVADSWASEKKFYDVLTGKCQGGECGHYSQIVWRATTQIGCATIKCGDKEFWICNYNPPGNYINKKAY